MAKNKPIQSVKGMHDVLPADQPYWQYFLKKANALMGDYSFERIDMPLVEQTPLFLRSIGSGTDVVDKEIYAFKTKGGDDLALRPEITAGIVRAYIEHGMQVMPQPVKLWAYGPVFRHDQPQTGRYRQFNQLDLESFGDDSPASDAEAIYVAMLFLESLGLKNLLIKINSIGDVNCRPAYLKALRDFVKTHSRKMCGQCRLRAKKNVLRVLDCKVETCRAVLTEAPQLLDFLDDACKSHFKQVIEFLDEVKAPYMLDPYLVRGLDYYTRTVFEIVLDEDKAVPEKPEAKSEGESEQEKVAEEKTPEEVASAGSTGLTLIAGGRYDGLVEFLGGQKTPAVGWGAGVERIISAMRNLGIEVPTGRPQPKVFLAQLGDLAKRKSLLLFENLRHAGIAVTTSLGRDGIKGQLRMANRLRVKFTLIVGQKEALDRTVILREMDSGIQESIAMDDIAEVIKKCLKSEHDR